MLQDIKITIKDINRMLDKISQEITMIHYRNNNKPYHIVMFSKESGNRLKELYKGNQREVLAYLTGLEQGLFSNKDLL